MAYDVYLGAMLCPVAPSKIEMKIKGQNKTLSLINDTQINVLKNPGLTEVSFDILLPNTKYPFASYEMGFKKAEHFLNQLESMKVGKKPFWFQVIRFLPTNEITHKTQLKVSLEDYTIKDDVKEGFDITVSIKLKQYNDYGTKIVKIIEDEVEDKTVATVENTRSTETAPELKSYTVVKGDCLWNIAKKYLGNGARYTEIYELNKDIIKTPYLIYSGQVLKMPTDTLNTPIKTTPKKTSTPKVTAPAKPTKKITVQISGNKSVLEICHAEYINNGKTKKATYKKSFNITVDAGSAVKLTIKREDNEPFKLELYSTPANIWTFEKVNTSVVVKTVADIDSTLNITWK